MNIYQERRQRLSSQLGPMDVAIIPTAPTRTRNRDSDHPYRFDSYFYYLTGFVEPDAVLLVNAMGESVLFCQPKDLEREIWDGYRLGPDEAPNALGVERAHSIVDINHYAPQYLANTESVWFPFGTHEGFDQKINTWILSLAQRARAGVRAPQVIKNACLILDEMRLIKDAHEIQIMKDACSISAKAHIRAMQLSAQALREKKSIAEYHLEAEMLHEFRRHGSESVAYTSIVAAGANACVLHYRADKAPVKDGDLVLIDAGCELNGYASDITRTFPANGRFTGPQRDLYSLVLSAQEASIEATRAGVAFTAPHDACLRVLSQGLLDLGLLNTKEHGHVDDILEHRHYAAYYMHRTSHWLGLDVHDCGSYVQAPSPESSASVSWKQLSLHAPNGAPTATMNSTTTPRKLEAGMVLTIEPGLYVRPSASAPEAFWNLGIRIEDDAWVRDGGVELLSREVPVSIAAIEQLMAP
jgi:Xaa-Pro aminopeptidase